MFLFHSRYVYQWIAGTGREPIHNLHGQMSNNL
jgi:hypothetical protein